MEEGGWLVVEAHEPAEEPPCRCAMNCWDCELAEASPTDVLCPHCRAHENALAELRAAEAREQARIHEQRIAALDREYAKLGAK